MVLVLLMGCVPRPEVLGVLLFRVEYHYFYDLYKGIINAECSMWYDVAWLLF